MARSWRASQILGKLNAEDAEELERRRIPRLAAHFPRLKKITASNVEPTINDCAFASSAPIRFLIRWANPRATVLHRNGCVGCGRSYPALRRKCRSPVRRAHAAVALLGRFSRWLL